jgi:uncharacterized protein YkwD
LILVVAVIASVLGAPDRGARTRPRPGKPIRSVLSVSTTAVPAAASSVSTAALYASPDPWKKYLAGEAVCPGGERTDLPPKSQLRTVACLVNFARQQRGLHLLSLAPRLDVASARKAQAILRCGSFAHDPCGGGWERSITSTGYVGAFGENLYLASGAFAAPRPTVDAWLNSAPHRENLFAARWRAQGLAVLLGRFGVHGRVAVWVNVLGDRDG